MKNIAIIGAGISGVSTAKLLSEHANTTLYEKKACIGGLIACDMIDGVLYHKVGGHVFNSKISTVLDWFWTHFDKKTEFIAAKRNAKILLNGSVIGYPIENHLYMLPADLVKRILGELIEINKNKTINALSYPDFKAFLIGNFGKTLYELYFKPYNQKIWRVNLDKVSMQWLEGKLPMPNFQDILFKSIVRTEETEMVHSSFYYPLNGGSQFIINRLAEGLDIRLNAKISQICYDGRKWSIDGKEFDNIIFSGDVRHLWRIIKGNVGCEIHLKALQDLKSHGTFNVLCECDATDLSWLYIPDKEFLAHRIIYTGNFSQNNNKSDDANRISCTVEFSEKIDERQILEELSKLPGNLVKLASNSEKDSYVIQSHNTREKIEIVKQHLEPLGFYLVGRFAEWEYYNMDKCIERAIEIKDSIFRASTYA